MENTSQRFEVMSIGSLVDRIFRIYGSHFALVMGISAVSYVPVYALQLVLNVIMRNLEGGPAAFGGLVALLVMLVLFVVAYPLATGAATYAVSELYLGRTVTIGEAYRHSGRKWRSLINTQMGVGLRVFFGFLLLIVPGILWSLSLALAIPVVIIEGADTKTSMRRSKELTAGHRREVAAVFFLAVLASMLLSIGLVSMVSLFVDAQSGLGKLLQDAASQIASLFATPISIIGSILLYYNMRIRKEGFDLEMLSQGMSGENPPVIPPSLPT